MSAHARPFHRVLLTALAGLVVEPQLPGWVEQVDLAPGSPRPVVGVVGLTKGCGATTVARALAVELACRDRDLAAVVASSASDGGGLAIGSSPSSRLARRLPAGCGVQTAGRLCLTTAEPDGYAALCDAARDLAPLVLDGADASQAAVIASIADALVLVAGSTTEPALGAALCESLGRIGPDPLVVANAVGDRDAWDGRCVLAIPQARVAARLAAAGREPTGPFAAAIAELADLIGTEST